MDPTTEKIIFYGSFLLAALVSPYVEKLVDRGIEKILKKLHLVKGVDS